MVLEHAEKLLDAMDPPPIPEDFAGDEVFIQFQEKILALREIMASFACGDLSQQIEMRGVVAGSCKALQANLRHMAWKVQQIEKGDYTQRMDFMGDFSSSFNKMVVQLESTIEALQQKEEALTSLAVSLQEEVKRRSATLLKLKKSEAEFKYLAQHDPLTGVFNRRSFFALTQESLVGSIGLKKDCCFCLLDIDYFKVFNDTHGHIEGDKALKFVADMAQSSLRQSDIMGRYGGEEFIFFFSNADLTQGYAAAERIRAAIENTPLALDDGKTVHLHASLGVAGLLAAWARTHSCSALQAHVIRLADEALYQAKKEGRNRVCIAELKELC
ncbi:GGDEF domain-containing protein [Desulfovibrio sp. MES5]|uniref:GGDEF domain-containing protein n=1 Tax=Desulfovibrio sp. MES5 TaxID=1899016 RepID=UPI0025C45435|nr:GGDEF domain-containing protein [Desulfovibrio sp. MES5]